MGRPQTEHPPSLLQTLMTSRRWTRERTLAELERRATQLHEHDFALSLRQLDRWLAGEVGVPRAATCRVVEKEFGHTIAELLLPSGERDQAPRGADEASTPSKVASAGTILTGWLLPDGGGPVHRIAICGSRAPGTRSEVIDAAVRALGRLLMHCRCRVSHGPIGVGIEVMTHIADHYRPPDLGAVAGIFGRPTSSVTPTTCSSLVAAPAPWTRSISLSLRARSCCPAHQRRHRATCLRAAAARPAAAVVDVGSGLPPARGRGRRWVRAYR